MFNLYVVLAGQDKVSDAGRATTCRPNFKALSLQTKSIKNEGPSENMIFSKKPFEDFNEKKNGNTILDLSKKPSGKKYSERVNWTRPS